MAQPGYLVDLVFVDNPEEADFVVGVNPASWPTAGNWVGGPRTIAHELHHLLGLPDRYDYVKSHAENRSMKLSSRLFWFHVQVSRGPDPLKNVSLMGSGNKVVAADVCGVAQLPLEECLEDRKSLEWGDDVKPFDWSSLASNSKP